MRNKAIHRLVVSAATLLVITGAQGASVNISVSPSTATVTVSKTYQFAAKVTPSSSGVTWNVNGVLGGNSTVGTISTSGVYTAPAAVPSPAKVTVSATSTADNTKSAQATVTIAGGAGVSITVSPTSASVQTSNTQQFGATVAGSANTNVTWSVNGVAGGTSTAGTVSTSGLYTAPPAVPSSAVNVTATSAADPTKSAQAGVTVVAVTPLTLSPSSAQVGTMQSAQFSVPGSSKNATYTWSVNGTPGGNSSLGTISSKGMYTAPAMPPSPATLMISASTASQMGEATATVVPVSVVVSPASASLLPSGTQQFTAAVTNATNTNVTWNVNGVTGGNTTVGTISTSGFYTAPATAPAVSITVAAVSAADPTKSGQGAVTVAPAAVSISITPTVVTLSNSQTQQFSATVMGSTNTVVLWSLGTLVGTLTANGQYTAPAPITASQTVTVTATSLADQTKTATATITLVPDTTAPTVSLTIPAASATMGGTVSLTATASDNIGVTSVQFYVDGVAVGSPDTSSPYSTPWNTVTYTNGAHTVSVKAFDGGGNSATNSATVTVSNAVTSVLLPIEVVGAAGTTQTATVNLGAPVSGTRLWMQIHNLKYETEASVKINNGPWIAINTANSSLQGLAAAYGGIGGGFATLKLTLSVPDGLLVSGANNVTFRFNGTDGVSSGFRVLAFNFLALDNTQLVNSSSFVQDDPNGWQPPSTSASDIAAGKQLFQGASLMTAGGVPIQAKCGMCHAQDGRDLKYFNYSNNSIRQRSMFHGLTQQQGDQIASYIRSLNLPNPGRPWNPPYQPGPGLDSQPVENWAAGAGLSALLDTDAEMLPYLMPGGSTANWAPTAFLNQRELPIAFQLPDWNRWLPTTHPIDAFGSAFSTSALNLNYLDLQSKLVANDPTSYAANSYNIMNWIQLAHFQLESAVSGDADSLYSTELWGMVKNWEINQQFGLEGMASTVFGPQAESRGWFSQEPFFASPNMLHLAVGSVGNGQQITFEYFSTMWYQLQLILNDGNGKFTGTTPIDFPYVYNFVGSLSYRANTTPGPGEAALMTEWLVKGLQQAQYEPGPDKGSSGWALNVNNPSVLATYPNSPNIWNNFSPSQITAIMNGYLSLWLAKANSYTPQQYYTGGWASPTEIVDPTQAQGTVGDQMANMFYGFRYYQVDPAILSQIDAWAQKVWPTFNWASLLNVSCTLGPSPWVTCQ